MAVPLSMSRMLVTRLVSHELMSALKNVAPENMEFIFLTELTTHELMSALKIRASKNIYCGTGGPQAAASVTLAMAQRSAEAALSCMRDSDGAHAR